MNKREKDSIYISIFKRKGGEGMYTEIIDDSKKQKYKDIFLNLEEAEMPLLICFIDIMNWVLLSNHRILTLDKGKYSWVYFEDILDVRPALQEEMKDGILDKKNFTRLTIRTKTKDNVICKLEQGNSYEGFYQVLSFIANSNKFG